LGFPFRKVLAVLTALAFCLPGVAQAEEPLRFPDGRPISWDSLGTFPLDYERPLTSGEKSILKDLVAMELGQAEAKAWHQMSVQSDSYVSAWALAQCARIKQSARELDKRLEEGKHAKIAPNLDKYLRYQAKRLIFQDAMNKPEVSSAELRVMQMEMTSAAQGCTPFASSNLGVTIGLVQGWALDISAQRKLVEAFRSTHSNGPDVRILLCRVYVTGVFAGRDLESVRTSGRPTLTEDFADAPKPEVVKAICGELLRQDPRNFQAHYYLGRALFLLHDDKAARKEFEIVAAGSSTIEPFRKVAKQYLALKQPAFRIFNVHLVD